LHTYEIEILRENHGLERNKQSAVEHYGYPSFEPEKYNMPPIVVKNIRDKIAEYEKKANERIAHYQALIDILKARNNKEVQCELYRQLNDRAEKDGIPQLHPQDIIKLICEQDETQIRKRLEENEAYSREQLKRFIVKKH
jgi:Mg/Co/Ni transporter MgtE